MPKQIIKKYAELLKSANDLYLFVNECPGGDSYITMPDGTTLRTDWAYVCDGLIKLIHYFNNYIK